MQTLKYIILFACAASSSSPHLFAGIIERDLLVPGDGLLTFDEVNQREWLDLPYTLGTLADVKSQMVPGKPLHGFQFATFEDVAQFNSSAGVSLINNFSVPGALGSEPKTLIDLLGNVFRAEGGILQLVEYTTGQVAISYMDNEPIFDDQNVVVLSFSGEALVTGGINAPATAERIFSGGYFPSPPIEQLNGEFIASGDNGPFWLYRNVVPEPTPSLLLAIGIAALLMKRNRL